MMNKSSIREGEAQKQRKAAWSTDSKKKRSIHTLLPIKLTDFHTLSFRKLTEWCTIKYRLK
jgi:hypothetical protein